MNRLGHGKGWAVGVCVLGVGIAVLGCGRPESSEAQGTGAKSEANPLSAPVDYLGATAAGKKSAERAVSLAPVLAALQQFHAAEDRYPARLQELVEAGFLARVPEALPGQALSYNPADGSVRWTPVSAR